MRKILCSDFTSFIEWLVLYRYEAAVPKLIFTDIKLQ